MDIMVRHGTGTAGHTIHSGMVPIIVHIGVGVGDPHGHGAPHGAGVGAGEAHIGEVLTGEAIGADIGHIARKAPTGHIVRTLHALLPVPLVPDAIPPEGQTIAMG